MSWIRALLIGGLSGLGASLVVVGLERIGVQQPLGSQPAVVIGVLSAIIVAVDLRRRRNT